MGKINSFVIIHILVFVFTDKKVYHYKLQMDEVLITFTKFSPDNF